MSEKLNIRKLIFLVISMMVSVLASAEPNFNREPLKLNYGNAYCLGDFEQFDKYIKDITPGNPYYLQYQMAGINSPNGLATVLKRMQEAPKDLSKISDLERLLFAMAISFSENPDKAKIKEYLDFKSSDRILDIYRQQYLALNDPDAGQALAVSIDAFAALPYLDSGILKSIYNIGIRYKDRERILNQFSGDIDKFPDNTAERYLLMAYREILSRNKNKSSYDEYAKKAYEFCKYDPEVAIIYVGSLIAQNKLDEADIVLRDQLKIRPDHSAYFDYYLGKILLDKGMKAEALIHLKEAKSKRAMLSDEYQSKLDSLLYQANGYNWIYAVITLLVFVFGAIFLLSRRRKN